MDGTNVGFQHFCVGLRSLSIDLEVEQRVLHCSYWGQLTFLDVGIWQHRLSWELVSQAYAGIWILICLCYAFLMRFCEAQGSQLGWGLRARYVSSSFLDGCWILQRGLLIDCQLIVEICVKVNSWWRHVEKWSVLLIEICFGAVCER